MLEKLSDIFERAHQRAQESQLPYAGVLLPVEAHALWTAHPNAQLVDVRTDAERVWVGRIPGAIEIEWMTYPEGRPNLEFESQLLQRVSQDCLVLFICRSGLRSHRAASVACAAAYTQSYNVLEGFEGDVERSSGQRGKLNGWRHAQLPWIS